MLYFRAADRAASRVAAAPGSLQSIAVGPEAWEKMLAIFVFNTLVIKPNTFKKSEKLNTLES